MYAYVYCSMWRHGCMEHMRVYICTYITYSLTYSKCMYVHIINFQYFPIWAVQGPLNSRQFHDLATKCLIPTSAIYKCEWLVIISIKSINLDLFGDLGEFVCQQILCAYLILWRTTELLPGNITSIKRYEIVSKWPYTSKSIYKMIRFPFKLPAAPISMWIHAEKCMYVQHANNEWYVILWLKWSSLSERCLDLSSNPPKRYNSKLRRNIE